MTAPRTIYAMNAEKLPTGEKTALLVPRGAADTYLIAGVWSPAAAADGTRVEAVRHMGGRYETRIGSVLAAHNDRTWAYTCRVRVVGICAVGAALSPQQAHALGFASVAEVEAYIEGERGDNWLLDVSVDEIE